MVATAPSTSVVAATSAVIVVVMVCPSISSLQWRRHRC
jgi:hypothetical protein